MLDVKQLRELIDHVTSKLGLQSRAATNLLLGTAAQESHLGTYIKQIKGPALGIYQMEPATEEDIWDNYLVYKPELQHKLERVCGRQDYGEWLWYDLAYQTAMCRIHYLRVPVPLPPYDNIKELGKYWKQYYNTNKGAGSVEEFMHNYYKYVGEV